MTGAAPQTAAKYAQEIKDILGENATNGAYWYDLPGGPRKLWTDFTSFAPLTFVMVTRISKTSCNQYKTHEIGAEDLSLTPSSVEISHPAKLSDDDINHIISPNKTVRWVVTGKSGIFYRMAMKYGARWQSDHGRNASCTYGYNPGFTDAYATPSANPVWQTQFNREGCGGLNTGTWLPLSGIHAFSKVYLGGHVQSTHEKIADAPAPYNGLQQKTAWGNDGYVLLSW